eukprot:641755-Rhodomonas_salina.1
MQLSVKTECPGPGRRSAWHAWLPVVAHPDSLRDRLPRAGHGSEVWVQWGATVPNFQVRAAESSVVAKRVQSFNSLVRSQSAQRMVYSGSWQHRGLCEHQRENCLGYKTN